MAALTYLDFDLSIEAISHEPTLYRARGSSLAAGQASHDFSLPFSAQDLKILFLELGRPRRGVRAIGSAEMQAAQAFGQTLFSHVFAGQVQSCLQRSLDRARQQGQGLRIRLRLSDAPDLADLPWEFLYDSSQSHFLAYSTMTPLVRYLDLPHTVAPLAVQPPLKVLVLIANPRDHGYATLNVEDEWRKVQHALAGLEERGLVQVTRLEAATLSTLQRQLRRDQYHIFHFVGHGGFDQQTQGGVLLLEDEAGRSRLVSGHYLGALLRDHPSLRLTLLNACEGARTSRADPFAGVAQHLVQQGIPAVIAMQFEITDQAAITISHEFYNALADNYGVDAALSEARKALFAAGNDMEWGTPVLYMRAQSGQLFEVTALAAPPVMPAKGAKPDHDKPQPPAAHQSTSPQTFMTATAAPPVARWRQPGWLVGLLTLLILIGVATQGQRLMDWVKARGGSVMPPTPTLTVTDVVDSPTAPVEAMAATPTPQATATHTPPSPATPTVVDPPTATATPVPPPPTATATALPPSPTATATAQPTNTPTPLPTPTPTLGIGATKVVTLPSGLALTFVYVPGGDFRLGSREGVGADDEHPQQTVAVAEFWMGKTEVTNAQFRAFVEAGGYQERSWWTETGWAWLQANSAITKPRFWDDTSYAAFNGDKQPVIGVSWYEAVAYARWLAAQTGELVQLPTEAEWEKAASWDMAAGQKLTYPWGDDAPTDQLLNYNNNVGHTTDVGAYPAGQSPYGALDMAGNVWEWTATKWLDNYVNYTTLVDNNPEGDGSARRVVRGGSWFNFPNYVRAAFRLRVDPDIRFDDLGFRLVVGVAPR